MKALGRLLLLALCCWGVWVVLDLIADRALVNSASETVDVECLSAGRVVSVELVED